MRPLRVVMMSNLCPPDYDGGFELRAFQIAGALRARGHDVQFVTSRYRASYRGPKNDPDWVHRLLEYVEPGERGLSRYIRFLAALTKSVDNAVAVERWLEEREFDLGYLFGLHRIGIAAHTPLVKRNIPILWHAGDAYLAKQLRVWPRKAPPYRWLLNTVYRRVQAMEEQGDYRRIAFVSANLRDYYAAVGLPTQQPYIVPRGIDFPLGKDVQRPRPQPPRFFMACRLHPQKGAHLAVAAAARLSNARPELPFRLEIAGKPEHPGYQQELLHTIEREGLRDRIALIGQLTRAEVLAKMREATAFIHGSTFDDPFANTIIESLAIGTPLIGSDVGSIREVVVDGESALLFPRGDEATLARHMEAVLDNPALGHRLAEQGVLIIEERYTLDRVLDLTEAAMADTLGEERGAECASV